LFNSLLLLVTIISDRLKYPHFHHTSDHPSTNQQHQTAIAPNINYKAIASNMALVVKEVMNSYKAYPTRIYGD
jgi:hypothetical protein